MQQNARSAEWTKEDDTVEVFEETSFVLDPGEDEKPVQGFEEHNMRNTNYVGGSRI